jgi:hypothetical protein
VLLFFGAGAEGMHEDAPMALLWPLALALVALTVLVARPASRRATWVATALLLVGVMVSVTGVVAIAVVAVYLLSVRGTRTALLVVAPGAVAFLVWFAVSGRNGGRVLLHGADYLQVPGLAWSGVTTPLGNVLGGGVAVGGSLLIAAVVATFVVPGIGAGLRALAWAGVVGASAQAALSAVASAGFGPQAVQVGRYQYVELALLVPALAVLLTGLVAASRRALDLTRAELRPVGAALIVAALLATATVEGISRMHAHSVLFTAVSTSYRDYTLGTVLAVDAGERILTDSAPNSFVSAPDAARLANPAIRDKLPMDRAGEEQRLTAESFFFVGVGTRDYGLFGPALVSLEGFERPTLTGTGCHDYQATRLDPRLDVAVEQGVELTIKGAATQYTTVVERDGQSSRPRVWDVEGGTRVHVASTATGALLRIEPNTGGVYEVCTGQ